MTSFISMSNIYPKNLGIVNNFYLVSELKEKPPPFFIIIIIISSSRLENNYIRARGFDDRKPILCGRLASNLARNRIPRVNVAVANFVAFKISRTKISIVSRLIFFTYKKNFILIINNF